MFNVPKMFQLEKKDMSAPRQSKINLCVWMGVGCMALGEGMEWWKGVRGKSIKNTCLTSKSGSNDAESKNVCEVANLKSGHGT